MSNDASPRKDKVRRKTKKTKLIVDVKETEKARKIRLKQLQHGRISFKKYKNRRMTPRQWLHLKFEYKQGLVASKCVPLPLNWRQAIHESMWWLPRAEKDGWWQEAMENASVARALRFDYTSQFYESVLDFATGGNVGRHEGGNMVLVIEGLQRTGKSDLAKTIAKLWQVIQWDIKGRHRINPKTGRKGVKPRIFVVLNQRELNEALMTMTPMDMLIVDELDKWTGLGSSNRAEGYANLVSRIAKTGKSFIFVSPEVRIPTIKALAYIVLIAFGICYAYEATRFIVSKKSRYTQQYKLSGVAALQRNWRYCEFKEYHDRKDASIAASERHLGLSTGFDRKQVEADRLRIWDMVYERIYRSNDELFYTHAISVSDWRDFSSGFNDPETGDVLIDIEGLGGEYAKYVCKGLSSRHKIARTEWRIDQKEGKALGAYAQELTISALPKSLQRVQIGSADPADPTAVPENVQIDFRQIINIPLEENYVETMYTTKHEAILEKYGQDTPFGKKIAGPEMMQLLKRMDDILLSWRLMALGLSSRHAMRELTKEGYGRSHVTVSKHFKHIQATIGGIMDELTFDQTHPHFKRVGGELVKGQRDFEYSVKKKLVATISKKLRNDKYWKPVFGDLSEKEAKDVLDGKPVFLVCTELTTQRIQYWIVKMITTKDHNETIDEWKELAREIFIDKLGIEAEVVDAAPPVHMR